MAWRPLGAVVLAVVALLVATINQYGYHRDELYFRVLAGHPAWGYVDQPPLTPMLAKLGIALFGDHLWSIRVWSIGCAVAAVLLVAALAREFGGGTGAQVLAAVGSCSSLVLVGGHLLSTASIDLVVWLLVILFAVRALLRHQPRWWLAAGVAAGLGLYNKQLVVLLLIGLFVGLLVGGPRAELRSPWPRSLSERPPASARLLWAGAGIVLVLGAPNLLYQIAHDWPQAKMAAAVARNKGPDDRVTLLPFQLILLGPVLVPVWIAGWIRLFRTPAVRALAWAYPVVLLIVLVTGGQPYYPFPLLLTLYAAGCVPAARWAAGRAGRIAVLAAALALSVAVSILASLPVLPVRSIPAAVTAVNSTVGDSVGWPAYVAQVATAYQTLPAQDRAVAVLLTANYGEAGALDRYGPGYGLPTVYSGHNELYRFGPPPDSARVVVVVGMSDTVVGNLFASCATVVRLDNGVGVDNEEQGQPVRVCRDPVQPWSELWPRFQHYD
jgi:4-amino-4-deoxy-L-arabinose transferase-like glycosyltransferase